MKHYCVISHTHWDREWYLTYEQFRLRLVDMLDHLLLTLEREPTYVFHLDAQTIVLEDYWQIKPENRDRCCRFIREGRLIIGPWYVQNDFLLTSGEATVRNLLLGRKQALEAGGCDDTGYTPDQFGLISQLPQILRGFGIDNCVFGRGYRKHSVDETGQIHEHPLPAELLWRSPDGSEVLGVCMSFWYNNAQRFSADPERGMRLIRWQDAHFDGIAQTPYLLLMNGVDHLQAQDDLLPILAQLQTRLNPDETIYQTTLHHYLQQVRSALQGKSLFVWDGEMITGLDPQLLKDCSSSRVYLKIQNVKLQNRLEAGLEPLYSLLEMLGMQGCYPAGHLDHMWKMLIANHAHDSICGCSKDAVHRHMEDRFAALEETGGDLQKRGMELLSAHISRDTLTEKDYLITVVNPLEQTRSQCIEVTVDVLSSDAPTGLNILDENGHCIPYTLLEHHRINRRMISPINLPGFREVERYRIRMVAENVPAFGYRSYRVLTDGTAVQKHHPQPSQTMQNDFLLVQVDAAGHIDLLHKATGHWYRDVLTLEDRADIGHSYISIPAPGDIPMHPTAPVQILSDCGDPQQQSITLCYLWSLPECYEPTQNCRSPHRVQCPVTIRLRLDSTSALLDIQIDMENRAKDHRLSALVHTDLHNNITTALSPFDLVQHDKTQIDTRICNETRHNSGCVSLCGEDRGMSVLNLGLYGYENLQREEGTLALTLVRSTGRVWPQDAQGAPEDDSWEAPENQCLRKLSLRLALYPHGADLAQAQVLFVQRAWQNPLLVHSTPVDIRKFLGGRPALQDSNIDEDFYLPDSYPQVRLPRHTAPWHLEGRHIQVTAWKKSFDRSTYILRFFNASKHPQNVVLRFGDLQVKNVYKSDLQEVARQPLCIYQGCAHIPTRGKEIVTLILEI